jgi:lipoate-protein ligase A
MSRLMFTKGLPIPFEILLPPKKSAIENMRTDTLLLDSLKRHPRTLLHLYSWEFPSATYGYFLDPSRYFKPEAVKNSFIEIARRPTGGGIIFHHCDVAYSVLIPAQHHGYSLNTLTNYAFINEAVAEAIKQFLGGKASLHLLPQEMGSKTAYLDSFCMAKPTKYDIVFEGRKVGGGAQRRTKYGLLHQGTICLYLPTEDFLKKVLLSSQGLMQAMGTQSSPLLGRNFHPKELQAARKEMQFILMQSIRKAVL